MEDKIMEERNNVQIQECGITIQVQKNHCKPNATATFYNPKMRINRQLVLIALRVYVGQAKERDRLPECLDAFSATGLQGLLWKRHIGTDIEVYVNDVSSDSCDAITDNCRLNGFVARRSDSDRPRHTAPLTASAHAQAESQCLHVYNWDANPLMYLKAFDFIHLDPFGSCVNYLDAAFTHIRSGGVLSVTSTDSAAFYAITPQVTVRSYGSHVYSERVEYRREMAVRVILGQVARSAGRHNKSISVLVSVCVEHMILVVVRVVRGAVGTDRMLTECMGSVLHCTGCDSHTVQSDTDHYSAPYLPLVNLLPCTCNLPSQHSQVTASNHASQSTSNHSQHSQSTSNSQQLAMFGPLWIGPIYEHGFVSGMSEVVQNELPAEHYRDDIQLATLMRLLLLDAHSSNGVRFTAPHPTPSPHLLPPHGAKRARLNPDVTTSQEQSSTSQHQVSTLERQPSTLERQSSTSQEQPSTLERQPSTSEPCSSSSHIDSGAAAAGCERSAGLIPFYYTIPRHAGPGINLPKKQRLKERLVRAGYIASETHFEKTAIRTNCPLHIIKRHIQDMSDTRRK